MKNIALIALLGSAAAVEIKQKSNQEKLYDQMFIQTEKIIENADSW